MEGRYLVEEVGALSSFSTGLALGVVFLGTRYVGGCGSECYSQSTVYNRLVGMDAFVGLEW